MIYITQTDLTSPPSITYIPGQQTHPMPDLYKMIAAISELQNQIRALDTQVDVLISDNFKLKTEIQKLKQKFE